MRRPARFSRTRFGKLHSLGAIIVLLVAGSDARAADLDASEIIRRAFAAAERNEELARQYTFHERVEERDLDKHDRVKSAKSKTYDVTLLEGSEYRRLVARDDQPLSPKEERKQQKKLDKSIEKMQNETPKQRSKRLAKVRKKREKESKFREEITRAYNFRLVGEEAIQGVDAYVIQAEPKPDYRPQLKDAKFLRHLRGKLWIAKRDYAWVQAKVQTLRRISIGWFLLRLNKGAEIEFTTRRINGEVWLPEQFRAKFKARVALVKGFHKEVSSTFANYRKLTTDSRIIYSTVFP